MQIKQNLLDEIVEVLHNDNIKRAYQLKIEGTKEQVQIVNVNSIKIIIDLKNVRFKKAVKKKIYNDNNGPRYPLQQIKLLLQRVPASVEFHSRDRADPQKLGITKEQAIEIIKGLQKSQYSQTSRMVGSQAADVYIAVRKILNEDIKLYIKFYIKNSQCVFVISFHESNF